MKRLGFCLLVIIQSFTSCSERKTATSALVLQTDFGVKDGAVSAMKGVAIGVDPDLKIFDLTHEIPPYNIWEAAYRLDQTAIYWPAGTVFVSVVDPGVGTDRKSVVLKTKTGHYFVGPDNGSFTLIAESLGIESIREIDSLKNRRQGSSKSYTFHGRDLYAFTGARLAANKISFDEIGAELQKTVIKLSYQMPTISGQTIKGAIPILDIQYGNLWTNIPDSFLFKTGLNYGDSLMLKIFHDDSAVYANKIFLARTFGEVSEGKPLAYFNSLMNFSVAINQGNFSETFKIGSGPGWSIEVKQ
jgi:S-adenosylmethionine hydrolase